MRITERQIKAQFNRSAHQLYDANAKVQPLMAADLLKSILAHRPLTSVEWNGSPLQVLEIGCGTGALTLQLAQHLPPASLITAVDLAPSMLEAAHSKLNACCPHTLDRVQFVEADAEQEQLPAILQTQMPTIVGGSAYEAKPTLPPFQLIASNACFQWFQRPADTLRAFRQLLATNGMLAFTTFGPDTMRELHASFQEAYALAGRPYRHHGLTFRSIGQWTALLEEAGFRILQASAHEQAEIHATPAAFLHAIKALGAAASEAGTDTAFQLPMNSTGQPGAGAQRRLFREMFKAYAQRFATPSGEGVTATYEALTFIAAPDAAFQSFSKRG
ncbi:methyltransferase domain-containing protein [Paenibacillus sp. MMS18-CY102]|uniref:methyltransferase domain-containing protein n=1 Tax=Paenibacillus sp. MMS18-CY102 TaxID=2682849 RepID=UPI0013653470|nr:methyltransferase domain-containing protein [Paenibacillus sp. MMS18-CY102]MWC30094.1 methyltransferase domain-containing protein [Paenibacillus sp. MMS18-CY102]